MEWDTDLHERSFCQVALPLTGGTVRLALTGGKNGNPKSTATIRINCRCQGEESLM